MSGRPKVNKGGKLKGLTTRVIAKLGRPIVKRFSELAHESLKQPGSWRCLEIVYRNEPRKILDHFFLNSRSAKGARNRLSIIQGELYKCIQQRSRISNSVRLISFGSGPGHEIFGSIKKFQGDVEVKATCVDRDPSALEYGRLLVSQMGLGNHIKYVRGNILHSDCAVAKYDVGILSGLLDYFDFETTVSVLKMVRNQLLPGGTVLIANMRQHYLASTMSTLGNWQLVYREPKDVEAVLLESGYKEIEIWLEPEKVFCIGKARKLGNW